MIMKNDEKRNRTDVLQPGISVNRTSEMFPNKGTSLYSCPHSAVAIELQTLKMWLLLYII